EGQNAPTWLNKASAPDEELRPERLKASGLLLPDGGARRAGLAAGIPVHEVVPVTEDQSGSGGTDRGGIARNGRAADQHAGAAAVRDQAETIGEHPDVLNHHGHVGSPAAGRNAVIRVASNHAIAHESLEGSCATSGNAGSDTGGIVLHLGPVDGKD